MDNSSISTSHAPQPSVTYNQPSGYIEIHGTLYRPDSNKNMEQISTPVIYPVALKRDAEGDAGFGIIIGFVADGKSHEIPCDSKSVFDMSRNIASKFSNYGVFVSPHHISAYLQDCLKMEGLPVHLAVKRSGYVKDKLAFVVGDTVIQSSSNTDVYTVEHPHGQSPKGVSTSGEFEKYKREVLDRLDTPTLKFAVIAALAPPLADIINEVGGGLHYFGPSGCGKSTMLQVGASVFGSGNDPAEGINESCINSWNGTNNSFDSILPQYSGLGHYFDELGARREKHLNNQLYSVCSGEGKPRLKSDLTMADQLKASVFLFSNGELSIATKIEQEGGTISAGISARIASIAMEPEDMMLEGESSLDTSRRIEAIKLACSGEYFGLLGPAFIETLLNDSNVIDANALKAIITEYHQDYIDSLGSYAESSIERRCISRFALVLTAGKLAHELGVLEWNMEEIEEALMFMLTRWKSSQESGKSDVDRAIDRIRDFIRIRYHSLCDSYDTGFKGSVEGYKHQELILLLPHVFQKLCQDATTTQVAKKLKQQGVLKHDDGKNQYRLKLPIVDKRQYYFAIESSFLEQD